MFWGFLHGMALIIHRAWSNLGFKMWTWLAWLITFNFVNIAWVFFRAKEWEDAMKVLGSMFSLDNVVLPNFLESKLEFLKSFGITFGGFVSNIDTGGGKTLVPMLFITFILVLLFKNSMERFRDENRIFTQKDILKYSIIFSIMFLIAILKSSVQTYSEFIYFNF